MPPAASTAPPSWAMLIAPSLTSVPGGGCSSAPCQWLFGLDCGAMRCPWLLHRVHLHQSGRPAHLWPRGVRYRRRAVLSNALLSLTVEAAFETGHSLTRLGPHLDVFGWGLLWVHVLRDCDRGIAHQEGPCSSRGPVKGRVLQDAEAEQASTDSELAVAANQHPSLPAIAHWLVQQNILDRREQRTRKRSTWCGAVRCGAPR